MRRLTLLFGLLPTFLATPAFAQGQGGRIPVRVVDGRLVTACDLSGPKRRIPVNLFIELDTTSGLQLHNQAAAPLGIEARDGSTKPIHILFPDFDLEVPRRELGDQNYLDTFTKYHSSELGENAVVGVMGGELFADWHLVLNVGAGWIELTPPWDAEREPPQSEGERIVTPITVENELTWLPVHYGDGTPAAFAIGSARYDSLIDAQVAASQGHPAGDIEGLSIQGLDFSKLVALRPEEIIQVHPDGVAGIMGVNLLESLRVEIDRRGRWAALELRHKPRYPAEEVDYFRALVEEDADGVEDFLEAHRESRLAREAADRLLSLRLDEFAPSADTERAAEWVVETQPKDLKATRALDLMVDLEDAGEKELALRAGEFGVPYGRDDRYPNAIHHIHGRLGHIFIDQGDVDEAWRHLLSAAFGVPGDGPVNLDLGRVYEAQGRYRRAFSRYLQAVIQPDSGPAAVEALGRVQPLLADGERFSVELIDRLIAGKVRSFGAATRFDPKSIELGGRVTLVEFFTSAHLGDEKAGAIGGALGNQGALAYFEDAPVAFLAWHLPNPIPSPLCNEAAELRARAFGADPQIHIIDGVLTAPGAARWHQADQVYSALQKRIAEALARESEYDLEFQAHLKEGRVQGELVAFGPEWEGLTAHVVLAEKGVLFPGRSTVVVHRRVARAELLGEGAGAQVDLGEGEASFPFDLALKDLERRNEAYLDRLEAQGGGGVPRLSIDFDPTQLYLVAFLVAPDGREVLQAAEVDLASEAGGE